MSGPHDMVIKQVAFAYSTHVDVEYAVDCSCGFFSIEPTANDADLVCSDHGATAIDREDAR